MDNAHNYRLYKRLLTIIAIYFIFTSTLLKRSSKYRSLKTKSGIKMHEAPLDFALTVILKSTVTPANLNDFTEFDELSGNIDPSLMKQSVITFDLGCYDLYRFGA